EILPLQVFYQSQLERFMIACLTHHDRYLGQSRSHSGAPSALASDQLIPIAVAPDYQRLNYALVSYGSRKLFNFCVIEGPSRLKRTRRNSIDVNAKAEGFAVSLNSRLGRAGNQRAQPSTQTLFR